MRHWWLAAVAVVACGGEIASTGTSNGDAPPGLDSGAGGASSSTAGGAPACANGSLCSARPGGSGAHAGGGGAQGGYGGAPPGGWSGSTEAGTPGGGGASPTGGSGGSQVGGAIDGGRGTSVGGSVDGGIVCDTGAADCDADPTNGCEVDLQVDAWNCGTCGLTCNPDPGYQSHCVGGQCVTILSCSNGFADCNHDPADGCEVNLRQDVSNCGRCGTVCELPNAIPTCIGRCIVGSCEPGFADCNGGRRDGCEVELSSLDGGCPTP